MAQAKKCTIQVHMFEHYICDPTQVIFNAPARTCSTSPPLPVLARARFMQGYLAIFQSVPVHTANVDAVGHLRFRPGSATVWHDMCQAKLNSGEGNTRKIMQSGEELANGPSALIGRIRSLLQICLHWITVQLCTSPQSVFAPRLLAASALKQRMRMAHLLRMCGFQCHQC